MTRSKKRERVKGGKEPEAEPRMRERKGIRRKVEKRKGV